MAWENSPPPRPPSPVEPQERLIGSVVCMLFLIFLTVIAVTMFMNGDSASWGWAIFGGGVVAAYRKWLL